MYRNKSKLNLPVRVSTGVALAAIVCLSQNELLAQKRLITAPIEEDRRGHLTGHVHPLATSDNDVGVLNGSEQIPGMTLILGRTPAQEADLTGFLAAQQDPSSSDYHRWLTPEEYGRRFGAAQADIDKITAWLEQHNLHVTKLARARNSISCTGTSADVGAAFRTQFHRYQVNGRMHFANATEPSLPVALRVAVRGIHGLNDFRMRPAAVRRGPDPVLHPEYNSGSGNHYLGPDDFAVIYNLKPLWNSGLDGTGQKIAIAGQTQIDLADLQQFRTKFHLPANDPDTTLVPNTRDPGTNSDDLGEADLDLEWAGAVAPNAKLVYVYSYDVMDAVQYAIDQNLAPVLGVSYGLCEPLTARSDALAMQDWARQANAQGMTWVNATGDSGGADCVSGSSSRNAGLSVDAPASIPEVTGVGGTTFSEGSGQYWAEANNGTGGSALSYIPEAAWNDSAPGDPAAGGGGASTIFGKPAWQVGAGVPDNGARNVPDVSLAASADHDGYMVYSSGKAEVYGGTSAGTPSFAGIVALLNQYLVTTGAQSVAGVGNVNPRLYALAQTAPSAFHDVLQGDNIVAVKCSGRSRGCVSGSYGYPAAPGYDHRTRVGGCLRPGDGLARHADRLHAWVRVGGTVVHGKYRPQRWISSDQCQGDQRRRRHTGWHGHAVRRGFAAFFGTPERRRCNIDGKLHARCWNTSGGRQYHHRSIQRRRVI